MFLLRHKDMGHLRWLCPGKLDASLVKIFPSSQMEPCVAQQANRWWSMSGAQKPMESCEWCMQPAFAVADPVLSASSVSGWAMLPKSRVK
jgi:hypothetical protein